MINALILRFRNKSYLRFNSQPCKKLSLRLNIQLTTSTVSKRECKNTFPLLTRLSIPCMRSPCLYNFRSMNAMARFRQWKAPSIFVRGNSSRGVEEHLPQRLCLWSSLSNFHSQQTLQFIVPYSMHLAIVPVKRASLRAQRRSRPVTLVTRAMT